MTLREMQMAFDALIQTVSKTMEIEDKPDSYTIVYFLNIAVLKYITDNFLSKGNVNANIEYLQKRSDILRNLIKRYTNTESVTALVSTEADGGISISVPDDYLYYIKSYSYILNTLRGITNKTWTPNRIIDHSELDKITNNITNIPILRKPCVVLEENNSLILYKDRETSIYNNNFVYLKKPLELSLDATAINTPSGYTNICELDESTHSDIVKLAVNMFIEEYKYKLTTKSKE